MASPHAESFYCISETNLNLDDRRIYTGVCIGCASLGMVGSLIQVVTLSRLWNYSPGSTSRNSFTPNASVIFFLAVADMLACLCKYRHQTCMHTVKARNNTLGGNVSKHPKTGCYFGPGRYLGQMNDFFHRYQHGMFYTKRHACIPYTMYGHVSIRSPPGHLHGRGRLHGSNVLTCCTWVRTRRVGVITGF